MNVVIASFNSTGFLYPSLAVAKEMQRRGHQVRVATGYEACTVLDAVGCEPLLRDSAGQTQAFDVSLWTVPEAVALQQRVILRGIEQFECDAIVAHPLMMGAALASERANIPLVQLGGAIALWRPGSWLFESFCERYAQLRTANRLSPCAERAAYWMGHKHLVRGVPELEPDLPTLPEQITHIGQCQLELQRDATELLAWLDRTRQPIVFAQLGRSFGSPGSMRDISEACASEGLALLVATERSDDECNGLAGTCFTAPYIPHALALPRCSVVIAGGHPSTVVAALVEGVPLVLLPSGSGTVELATACARAGAGLIVSEDARTPVEIAGALRTAIADPALLERARALRTAFARYDGPALSCDVVEQLLDAT